MRRVRSELSYTLFTMGTIDVLKVRVKEIFRTKGFSNIDIDFVIGSAKGDGVIGNILPAKISALKEGVPENLDVVIKCAPTDSTFRKTMPVRNLFIRECWFYNKLAPVYENLQDLERIPNEIRCILPKCYGFCDDLQKETIVLEDLNMKDFRVMPLQVLDYDHAAIILRNIAKLHALSFVYEERYPREFREVAEPLSYILDLANGECNKDYIFEHGEKTMKQFTNAITDMTLRRRFEAAAGTNAIKKFSELLKIGKIKAFLHGDNWLSNHMFKYEDGQPTEGIPMDFQWSMYSSIAYDFMYLFSFSIPKVFMTNISNTFYQLVDAYYGEFKKILFVFGYDGDQFCTYEQLKNEIKSLALTSCLAYMVGAPLFKNPDLTLPQLISSPEAYVVTEEYKDYVNDMVTAWANLGFI